MNNAAKIPQNYPQNWSKFGLKEPGVWTWGLARWGGGADRVLCKVKPSRTPHSSRVHHFSSTNQLLIMFAWKIYAPLGAREFFDHFLVTLPVYPCEKWKTLHGTLSRAQHAAGAAEPALGFGPGVVSSSMVSWYFQTRAAREPPTRNTFPDEVPLSEQKLCSKNQAVRNLSECVT